MAALLWLMRVAVSVTGFIPCLMEGRRRKGVKVEIETVKWKKGFVEGGLGAGALLIRCRRKVKGERAFPVTLPICGTAHMGHMGC